MPWFDEFLMAISHSRRRSRPGSGRRVLAATLSLVLVLGTVAPGIAFAGEIDSEQEGSAPPGALPGLEEGPELAPGGDETSLEELPGAPVESEGAEEGPPIETEPAQESELPAPAPEAPEASAEAPPDPPEATTGTPAPGPEYSPDYEPAPAPSQPVENQPIAAPQSSPPAAPAQHSPSAAQAAPAAPAPVAPSQAPAPEPVSSPPATPAKPSETVGTLAGHSSYTVHSGDCLWSIAERLLPAGAGVAQVEAEVARLWRLNAARIGTGDPNLIYSGTALQLH
jgi:hypothetical protein